MFSTSQKLSLAITEIEKLYNSKPEAAKFFVESLRQLKSLRQRLSSKQVRIAIIGITSSGKSTLMNAILGEKLLPTRVGPTSSKQVVCGYDKEKYALIIFEDELQKANRKVERKIFLELSKYGDEKNNPTKRTKQSNNLGNSKGVAELQVFSPAFKFRKELIFIDTPGLDAYGLTDHEEITLKLVLPSVDMVLFLTNVKCDSDNQNLDFIDRATSEDKPLIIVQNKIDSIEEKRSKTYGIEKTKAQVQQEHYNRIQRLLKNAHNESVRNAPIVQVSAKATSWKASNLENLNEVLSAEVDKSLERFREGHVRQFQKQLEDDLSTLSRLLKDHSLQEKELAEQKKVYDGYYKNVQKAKQTKDTIDKEIKNKLIEINNTGQALIDLLGVKPKKAKNRQNAKQSIFGDISAIFGLQAAEETDGIYEKLPKSVESKYESFKKDLGQITAFFSSSITEMQKALQVCCADMNLNYRQIVKIEPAGIFHMQAENITETVKGEYQEPEYRTRKVPRKSFGGSVKRFFGSIFGNDDWGYDEEEVLVREGYHKDKIVYSVKKMTAFIVQNCKKLVVFFDEKYPNFDKQTKYGLGELQNRYDNLVAQLKIQSTGELSKEVINQLQVSIQKMLPTQKVPQSQRLIKKTTPLQQLTADSPEKKLKAASLPVVKREEPNIQELFEKECLSWEAAFLHLAQSQSLTINHCFMLDYIKKSNLKQILVCGWDDNSIDNFLNFFFAEQKSITNINFNKDAKYFPTQFSNRLLFLLVNAEQPGSTENKLYSPEIINLLSSVAKTGKIVWVMDDVNSLAKWRDAKQDSLAEAYSEMVLMAKKFMKQFDRKPYDFMACDSDLYYSVLFHELYFADFNTEVKRQRFIAEMREIFHLNTERTHITGQYLNDFANLQESYELQFSS